MTDPNSNPENRSDSDIQDVNRRFYDGLWSGARLVSPERFNTWPLISTLIPESPRRLEVGPGKRPRLPLHGTHFADISQPAVNALTEQGGIASLAGVTDLPYEDSSFDLVCALDIVEHVENDEAAIAELARVAAPGAHVLLSTPLHPEFWSPFDDLVGHFRRYPPEELVSLLDRHGLTIEQSAIFGMKPRSTRLSRLGLWFLRNDRFVALRVYNRVLMPLGLRLQKPLTLHNGLADTDGVDEIFLVCRRK